MGVPSPEVMVRKLAQMRELISDLEENVKWAHGVAYPMLRANGDVKIRSGGPSDPTGTTATTVTQARFRLSRVWRATGRAFGALREAQAESEAMFHQKDDLTRGIGRGPHIRTVTKTEMAELEAAQRRRRQRGEGYA